MMITYAANAAAPFAVDITVLCTVSNPHTAPATSTRPINTATIFELLALSHDVIEPAPSVDAAFATLPRFVCVADVAAPVSDAIVLCNVSVFGNDVDAEFGRAGASGVSMIGLPLESIA
jgi:hypothetical protein